MWKQINSEQWEQNKVHFVKFHKLSFLKRAYSKRKTFLNEF